MIAGTSNVCQDGVRACVRACVQACLAPALPLLLLLLLLLLPARLTCSQQDIMLLVSPRLSVL
jgi:hypothetical protein